ncbi:beclin 1-associated autophagy-related key regulator-like [Frankliniella occidentalis]|uniref:Beclin 1-associated autophagy-related key regulator isoform X1 n=1 Tax=Frankliniella occidentalis TaxID=133901 RepID=A0A6J1T190_FRAOC|nr:beclin 1-associated autophagy-related key regulator isoform X1 [Frankliniella occidentalis]KAE8746410.1 beclin 1-associated autophagy-related key regulator-like [Frankliniella occidentalis]
MATSGSDDSCIAPADFNLSSLIEDSTEETGVRESCPLCQSRQKSFHCTICVRNGDFVLSTSPVSERFAEKQLRLLEVRKRRLCIEKECERRLMIKKERDVVKNEIDACRDRVQLLRLLLTTTKDNISENEALERKLKEENGSRLKYLPVYSDRVKKVAEMVVNLKATCNKKDSAVKDLQEKLKRIIRSNVHQLVRFIFPISVITPSRSMEDCNDTVSALADALRTTYIRGRWVFTDSTGELQHCIVAPMLPGSGNYSAYNDWVASTKDGVPSSGDTAERNPGYNISAALTYTTQLINVLAFYLDVRLPCKLHYSDFCGTELSEQKFAKRVARLNWNVLHLCFSQSVSPDLLHPNHTLSNILHLLDTQVSDLGRQGPLEIDPMLAISVEDQLQRDLAEASDDSGSEDESDALPLEWENVPLIPGCPEMPGSLSQLSQQMSSTQQATSMAGGLVTSIASVWRGLTGNR